MRQALHLLRKQPYRVPRHVRYHYAAGPDVVLNTTMRPRRKYFHCVVNSLFSNYIRMHVDFEKLLPQVFAIRQHISRTKNCFDVWFSALTTLAAIKPVLDVNRFETMIFISRHDHI